MKIPSISVQRQQTKVQFANAQDYLNYELGNAQRRLPPPKTPKPHECIRDTAEDYYSKLK